MNELLIKANESFDSNTHHLAGYYILIASPVPNEPPLPEEVWFAQRCLIICTTKRHA